MRIVRHMKKPYLFLLLALLSPSSALACACGCGIFDVSTSTILPNGPGGTAFIEYDFNDQRHNHRGGSGASAADNEDKHIRTDFVTVGGQYMFNRSWGLRVAVPYVNRFFETTDDVTGDIVSTQHSSLGDIRVNGIYSGFSDDMSTGIIFGLKLPTGDYDNPNFDRDTQIGTGSTDTMLGAYHYGRQALGQNTNWFARGVWEHPVVTTGGYRPGDELNGAVGIYRDMGQFGVLDNVAPILQVIGSGKFHDTGRNSDSDNTGYTQLFISPGVEADIGKLTLYGDIEVPVYRYTSGNQLVAPTLFKVLVSYKF